MLIEQLKFAGVNKTNSEDKLTERDKTALLDHLRKRHGNPEPRDIRDRNNAIKISHEIFQLEQLRNHYFAMPLQELDFIWNKGDNELESPDRELVRLAIRDKKDL